MVMAMLTASEILGKAGIKLNNFRNGNQKALCPKCSHTRKKKRDRCLSVEIGDAGVRWNCFNCGWGGGEYYDQDAWQRDRGVVRKPQNLPRNGGALSRLYR
jgi:twinkle protein